jgi:hypothetical protein
MNPTGPGRGDQPPIKIDYDRLDVADIMAQIKAGIVAQPPEPAVEPVPPADGGAPPPPDEPEPPSSGLKGRLKRLFFTLMRPFAPVQKLLALPTHRELMETVRKLHQTNLRIEEMVTRIDAEFRRVNGEIGRTEGRVDVANERIDASRDHVDGLQRRNDELLQGTNERLGEVHRTVNARIDDVHAAISDRIDLVHRTTNERVDGAYGEIQRSMEFVKLLHNLSHNIVVELSKLKIEEEGLKLKTRVMEKDFEFLGRRERALEKEILK